MRFYLPINITIIKRKQESKGGNMKIEAEIKPTHIWAGILFFAIVCMSAGFGLWSVYMLSTTPKIDKYLAAENGIEGDVSKIIKRNNGKK